MKPSIALVLVVCSLALGQTPAKRPNRRALFRQLDSHVGIAMTRAAKLSDKDRKKLDQARQVVQDAAEAAAQARPKGQEVHNAFKDIEKRAKSFQEDDRKLVLDDLRQLRALGVDRQRPQRAARPRGNPRPWPGLGPRFPRRPRF